jgi:hypothetical protein
MDRLLNVYQELADQGVALYTWDIGAEKAATLEVDGRYAVFMDLDNISTRAEELVVIAHEGGHCSTGATHKVCSPYDLVEKHEYKAWKWAIQRLVPEAELEAAVKRGLTEAWELAEHFQVTEPFLRRAVAYYRSQKME